MIIYPYNAWLLKHPPVLPALYWDVVSQEQRIAEICRRVYSMEEYLKYLSDAVSTMQQEIRTEVRDMIAASERAMLEALDLLRDDVTDEIEELKAWVHEQTFGIQTWDVTRGLFTDSVDAMRRTFFDVTIDGATVDQLATSTKYPSVDALAQSGWNCRALAVIGGQVLDIIDVNQWKV